MTTATGTSTVQRTAFAGLLALTMASSTFVFTTFSVLSEPLLRTFDIDRWQLGALVTTAAVVGAVLSPPLGRVADRIGGRSALLATLVLSAAALSAIALSPVYALVIAAGVVAGAAQAMANPATNKLISLHGTDGGRGALTGIKQSGVQVGTFFGGSLLPLGATTIGWRPTLLLAAAVPVVSLIAGRMLVPAEPESGGADGADGADGDADRAGGDGRRADGDTAQAAGADEDADPDGEAPDATDMARSPFLVQLAGYGFLLGAGWSAVFTYLPDYGRNALGWDPRTAGLLVSAAGLFGIAGRIGWSWFAEHRSTAPRTLSILAAIGVVAVALILASGWVPALLWLGAAALGGSSGSWNSVGMFAIIDRLPEWAAGAGSGVVMFGFLVGLGVGAPAFGWSVDVTGAYVAGLVATAVIHALGLAMALVLGRADLGDAVTEAS